MYNPHQYVRPAYTASQIVKSIASGIGAVVLIVIALALGSSTLESMPPQAQLLASLTDHTYISPPCLALHPYPTHTFAIRAKSADELHFKPDDDCRDASGFVGSEQSTLMHVVFPKPSRWNADGSWRW